MIRSCRLDSLHYSATTWASGFSSGVYEAVLLKQWGSVRYAKNWVHGGHRKVLPSGMYCTFHIVKTAKCCFLILIAKFVFSDFIWVHPACAVAFLLGIYHYLSIQVLFEYWIIDNFHTPNRGVNSAHSGPDNNVIIYSIFDLLHMNMRGLPLGPNRVWHMNWGRNHSFVLALAFPAGQRKDLIFALCFQHWDNRGL